MKVHLEPDIAGIVISSQTKELFTVDWKEEFRGFVVSLTNTNLTQFFKTKLYNENGKKVVSLYAVTKKAAEISQTLKQNA